MSSWLLRGLPVILMLVFGIGWLICARQEHAARPNIERGPNIISKGNDKVGVQAAARSEVVMTVLNCTDSAAQDISPWKDVAGKNHDYLVRTFVTLGTTERDLAAFFKNRHSGLLVFAGEWEWNKQMDLHYLRVANRDLAIAFHTDRVRQVVLWEHLDQPAPRRLQSLDVDIQFSEDVRAVLFTGAALSAPPHVQALIDFFGDHKPLLGWREPVPNEVWQAALFHPESGFLANLILNRQEREPEQPSIALRWLQSVSVLAGTVPAVVEARMSASSVSLIPDAFGPVQRVLEPASPTLPKVGVRKLEFYREVKN
jgi:hypothetical protein